MIHYYKISIAVIVLVVLVSMLPSCTEASDPIEVTLLFSEPPLLGKPVQVTATFINRVSYSEGVLRDVEAAISFSEGFELVEGELNWRGDLIKDTPQKIQVTVKTMQLGTYEIRASAHNEINNAMGFDWYYVTVTENSAGLSKYPQPGETKIPVQTDPPSGYSTPSTLPANPLTDVPPVNPEDDYNKSGRTATLNPEP
jgi:hypothetical protein